MQFTVTYEDGVWVFEVSSLDDEPDFHDRFELTEVGEACDAAWDLVKELAEKDEDDGDGLALLFKDE